VLPHELQPLSQDEPQELPHDDSHPPQLGAGAQDEQLGAASQHDGAGVQQVGAGLQHLTLTGLHLTVLHFTGLHFTGLQQ
jgi:hypothetical protein